MVGQVLVAIPHLVVEVARSPIAIGVGLTGLHLVIIGLENLGMFLVDIVDVVAHLIVVIGVGLGGVWDEDILDFVGIGHGVLTRQVLLIWRIDHQTFLGRPVLSHLLMVGHRDGVEGVDPVVALAGPQTREELHHILREAIPEERVLLAIW